MKFKLIFVSAMVLLMSGGCGVWRKTTADPGRYDLSVVSIESRTVPLLRGSSENTIVTIKINYRGNSNSRAIKGVLLDFTETSDVADISGMKILCGLSTVLVSQDSIVSGFSLKKNKVKVSGNYSLQNGENLFTVNVGISQEADLKGRLRLEQLRFILDDGSLLPVEVANAPEFRFATVVRTPGQDNCNTYRIPGLITTNKGTLIAVYDARFNSSKDLQEDINIGMSRSTDGGENWEPMKIIMDMDGYGGRPRNENGTGDPCVLYDNFTNTIWVAALWFSGSSPDQVVWWASKPGMNPEETGQFLLIKSTDDGLIWSKPESITSQIKNPAWQLLFQGPGRGITMKDGTLVFPAQYKADIGEKALDGGQYTCHSTIVWSKDEGRSWHIGTGVKSNTTEAQVVELADGSLMLNMRDDRNRKDKGETNGRAVAVTRDLGKSWSLHSSSNHELPEPNCMASLIAADLKISGSVKKVLFFSNPDNMTTRSHMTIKASLDEGMTWPKEYQVLLDQDDDYGYSCLTMIDDETMGILYEGVKELYFQKIPIKDILKGSTVDSASMIRK